MPLVVAKTWDANKAEGYDFATHHVDLLYGDAPFVLLMVLRSADSTHCEQWTCTRKFGKSEARTDYFAQNKKSQKVYWIGSINYIENATLQDDPKAKLIDELVRDMWKMTVVSEYGEHALKGIMASE